VANNGTPKLDLAMRISADLGDVAQEIGELDAALDQLETSGKRGAKGLDGTATAAGKAATETARATTATKANAQALKEQASAADKSKRSTDAAGVSARQTTQAMRQLPMQVTDIVTGLAGGQNPLLVLVQQGGQLKDSFGGVVPAARALLGVISPLAVGLTLTGGAIAVVTAGMVKGYQEIRAYDEALISTGSITGKTSGQLADMGDQVGQATGRYGDADAALLQLAQSGKLAGGSLDEAAGAAVNLAKLTGDSIESTTDKIIELAAAPTKTLVKLNDQYHFLTLSVYEHVRSLEDQGRAEDAARVAIEEFARVHEQRVKEAEARAGYLERAWKALGETVAGVWDSIKSIGRTDNEARLAVAQSQLDSLRRNRGNERAGWFPGAEQQAEALVASLQAEAAAAEKAAAAQGNRQAAQDKAIKASAQLRSDLEQGAAKSEKYATAVKKLNEQFIALRGAGGKRGSKSALLDDVVFGADGSISGGAYDKRIKQLQEQYKETKPKTPKAKQTGAQKEEAAAQRALVNLKEQIGLLDDLDEGETKVSEAARMRFQTTEGDYKNASDATKQQLIDQAQLLDTERLRTESARKLVAVQLEIARLQGRGEDGDLAKARTELGRLQADLEKLGRTKEAADVAKLLNLKVASVDLKNLRQTYDQTMGEIALEQQRIQVELQAGLLTEGEAQQRIVDLYKDKLVTLNALVPQMRASAKALGDPAAVAAVEQIALKLREMQATTNLLQQAVRTTFQESFKQALTSLVDGTSSLTEAVRNFFGAFAEGIGDFAIEQLSQKAGNALTGKLSELFPSLLGTAGTGPTPEAQALTTAGTTAAAAIVTAGTTVAGAIAAAGGGAVPGQGSQWGAFAPTQGLPGAGGGVDTGDVASAATAMQGAGDTVNAGALAIGQSAAQLAAAAGGLSPGASAVIQAAFQLLQAALTMQAANTAGSIAGFAEGGFTGFGGKYQVKGVVHAGEGVLNAAEIRSLGGPRGFYALRDAIRNGYADGGLVMDVAEPRTPTDMPSAGGARTLDNRLRVVIVDDPERIPRALKSEVGEESFLYHAGRNVGQLKQLLEID
jgi:phage-related minor tail protein